MNASDNTPTAATIHDDINLPKMFWLNTSIGKTYFDEELPQAYIDDADDMEALTGYPTFEELTEDEIYKQTKKTNSRADFMLSNNCAVIGWAFPGQPDERKRICTIIEKTNNISQKAEAADEAGSAKNKSDKYSRAAVNTALRLKLEPKPGDIIWMRDRIEGIYYAGQVAGSSHWRFDDSKEAIICGSPNQLTNIKWMRMGTEENVPGIITTATSRQTSAFFRIGKNNPSIETATKITMVQMNHIIEKDPSFGEPYPIELMCYEREDDPIAEFYQLLSPDDVEDLLSFWLARTKGYLAVPSSNKRGTAGYEFCMVNPETGRKCYPQVKNGSLSEEHKLDAQGYENLVEDGEVYLLVTVDPQDSIENFDNPREGVICFSEDEVRELYRFACDNKEWLPGNISKWICWMDGDDCSE